MIAARDPGVGNWVDTTGLAQGVMVMRWQAQPRGPLPVVPPLTTRVVPLSELPARLPAGAATITPEQRAARINERRKGFQRAWLGRTV